MKFLIESHIPYIKGLYEAQGVEVEYLEPNEFTREACADADALVIRTRTRCNADLLDGSRCRFIATATIGTDHIDLDYCRSHDITVKNAPGCNAPAVAQYVHSTIYNWLKARQIELQRPLSLAVVGVGHVGSIIARWGKELGMNVLSYDPPRAEAEGAYGFATLDEVLSQADVITIHTPLTRTGNHATFHLANEDFFSRLQRCRLIINSARGGVIDEAALLAHMDAHPEFDAAIDCWEHEPAIDLNLLSRAFVATPHIAGYSSDGKTRATSMTVASINEHFHLNAVAQTTPAPILGADGVTPEAIMQSYNPLLDTEALKQHPDALEAQRNHYNLRKEVY